MTKSMAYNININPNIAFIHRRILKLSQFEMYQIMREIVSVLRTVVARTESVNSIFNDTDLLNAIAERNYQDKIAVFMAKWRLELEADQPGEATICVETLLLRKYNNQPVPFCNAPYLVSASLNQMNVGSEWPCQRSCQNFSYKIVNKALLETVLERISIVLANADNDITSDIVAGESKQASMFQRLWEVTLISMLQRPCYQCRLICAIDDLSIKCPNCGWNRLYER